MRKVIAFAAVLGLAAAGIAQEPPATRPAPRPAAPGGQIQPIRPLPATAGQAASADQQLAACIFLACRNEVEVAKLAQSKLQSEEVRAFAEKMIREHTPDCEAYQKLAGSLASLHHEAEPAPAGAAPPAGATPRPAAPPRPAGEPPAAGAAPAPPPSATPRVDVEVAPRAGGAPPSVDVTIAGRAPGAAGSPDWITIHRQLADACLASTKQELGRHQGPEFDRCFMGQQMGAHMMVLDELKVLKNHASPQLAAQFDKSIQVVQAHLQEARQITERMKDTPSERVSRKPEGNK